MTSSLQYDRGGWHRYRDHQPEELAKQAREGVPVTFFARTHVPDQLEYVP